MKNKRKLDFLLPIHVIKEMALELAKLHNVDNFKASNGYINRFMTRHNLLMRSVCGESSLVKQDMYENSHKDLMKNYSNMNRLIYIIVMRLDCFGGKALKNSLCSIKKINYVENKRKNA